MIKVGKNLPRMRGARVEECIIVEVGEGRGINECCYRIVVYIYNAGGTLIAKHDPYPCECCGDYQELDCEAKFGPIGGE